MVRQLLSKWCMVALSTTATLWNAEVVEWIPSQALLLYSRLVLPMHISVSLPSASQSVLSLIVAF